MPSNDKYQIDAFSYIDSTRSLRPILKAAQVSGVSVAPGEVTNVSLVLESPDLTFALPDTVEKGDTFTITANMNGFMKRVSGFQNQILSYIKYDSLYINQFTSDNTDYLTGYSGGETILEWDDMSISEFDDKKAYFQVISKFSDHIFYFNDEQRFSFVHNYPNPYIPDTVKTFISVPDGGIGIDVEY